MANLKLNNLTKKYPSGTIALYDASLEVADKQLIAVVGGTKSGKSTLLRLVAGLDTATSGEIYIGNKNVTEVPVKDRDVAMMFQSIALNPNDTVAENIAYGLILRKANLTLIEQRVNVVVNMLGLTDVLARKPKAITAEQKQKVILGRALAREPKLYLLDDPFAGLDEDLKVRMLDIMVKVQARMDGTFIYSTKNVNEAMAVATKLVVLKDGFVQQIDTAENLYDYPANAYVAFLIGAPTINFITATLSKEGEDVVALFGENKLTLASNIVARFEKLEEYVGTDKKVVLGIRPEDIKQKSGGDFGANVYAVEDIDGENFVACEEGEFNFTFQANANKGDRVRFNVDNTKLYVFDDETRLTLLANDAGYTPCDGAFATTRSLKEEQAIIEKAKPVETKKKK